MTMVEDRLEVTQTMRSDELDEVLRTSGVRSAMIHILEDVKRADSQMLFTLEKEKRLGEETHKLTDWEHNLIEECLKDADKGLRRVKYYISAVRQINGASKGNKEYRYVNDALKHVARSLEKITKILLRIRNLEKRKERLEEETREVLSAEKDLLEDLKKTGEEIEQRIHGPKN